MSNQPTPARHKASRLKNVDFMLDSANEQENQLRHCISTITKQLEQEGLLLEPIDSGVPNRDHGLAHMENVTARMTRYRQQLMSLANELIAAQGKREELQDLKDTLEKGAGSKS